MAHAKDSATQWSPMLRIASQDRRDEASQTALPQQATTTALCITTGITITVPSDPMSLGDAPSSSCASKRSPTRKKKPTTAAHSAGKSLMQSIWDEDEMKKSATLSGQQQQQQQCEAQLGAATSTLAKFKAAQDLKIQTANLPEPPTPNKESSSTSSSTFTTPGTDTSSAAATPRSPVPPSSTGKKRRRRTAAQIDRKFSCNYPGCPKAYGSEGSLTQHQRLKHRQQGEAGTSAPNNQLGSFFLPLHQSARSRNSSSRPPQSQPRTVTIRPATMEGVMSPISFDLSSSAIADAASELLTGPRSLTEQLLSVATSSGSSKTPAKRQNLRSRSNSMPVSFSSTSAPALTKQTSTSSSTTTTSSSCTPRPQTTRKSRTSSTPRAKAASSTITTTTRRVKSRSKSETLSETTSSSSSRSGFLAFNNDVKPPRSVSDSFVSSSHASILMPPSSSNSTTSNTNNTAQSFDGNYSGHRHSYDWSSSIASDSPSSDQAIDSDILSVLADCDSSDVEGSDDFGGGDNGPPSTSSFRSQRSVSFGGEPSSGGLDVDQDMMASVSGLDCFGISESAPVTLATVGGMRIDDLFRRAESVERAATSAGAGGTATGSASHHRHSHGAASPVKRTLDLEPFAIKGEHTWGAASAPSPGSTGSDAGFLSTHMEKMSMIHATALNQSPHHHQDGDALVPLPVSATSRVTTTGTTNSVAVSEESCLPGVMANLDQFAAVSVESFSVVKQEPEGDLVPESMDICEPEEKESFVRMMETEAEGENQLSSGLAGLTHANWIFKYDENHSNNNSSSSMAMDHAMMHHGDSQYSRAASMGMKSPDHDQQQNQNQNQQQMHWMKDFSSLSALEAQNQYVDELFQETMAAATVARGSHKHQQHMTTDSSAHHNFLRGLGPVPPGNFNLFASDNNSSNKHLGAFNSGAMGDFLFDVSEYGLEDTRMGSPLLCQQEEL